jgi:hypothetical protein
MRGIHTAARFGAWAVVAAFGLTCVTGCGSGQYDVRGKLVYADTEEPVHELADSQVIFTSEKLGKCARGTIQADGSFRLGTVKDEDGVVPGEYVVTLTQPYREPDRPYVGDRVVDTRYEDPATSDLRAEVKAEKNEFVFKLQRIPKKGKK